MLELGAATASTTATTSTMTATTSTTWTMTATTSTTPTMTATTSTTSTIECFVKQQKDVSVCLSFVQKLNDNVS